MRRILQTLPNQRVMKDKHDDTYIPLTLPENPVNYAPIIKDGLIGKLKKHEKKNTKVLVIGAGAAGLCAAYELLRKGLEPTIYEAQEWNGGRIYTYDMPDTGGDRKYVEQGAMRIPQTHVSVFNYLYNLGVMKRQIPTSENPSKVPFKNDFIDEWPLFPSPKAVDTRIQFEGKVAFYQASKGSYFGDEELIAELKEISNKFERLLTRELANMRAIDRAFHETYPDPTPSQEAKYDKQRLVAWRRDIINQYADKSLFEVLSGLTGDEAWTREQLTLLGTVGIGTGGVGSIYTTVYLEILREAYHGDSSDQRLISGGVRQLADAFAMHVPRKKKKKKKKAGRSLAEINGWEVSDSDGFPRIESHPRKRVTKIRTNKRDPAGRIKVWHDEWKAEKWERQKPKFYDSVILTASLRAIEMYIDINPEAFNKDVWHGIRHFGMVDSHKMQFYCKTKWWEEWNAEHDKPEEQIVTTLTDRTLGQTYFIGEFGRDPRYAGEGGIVLVDYCWSNDASKFSALTLPEKIDLCMREFETVFPKGAVEEFQKSLLDGWEEGRGVQSIVWNDTPYMNGAFRMAEPGQYEQHTSMYEQGSGEGWGPNNGLYLAGESLAWFGLSGWIEGALYMGINAAQAVMNRITAPDQGAPAPTE